MNNRRNYYRILHVQADAPLAVIKSSYKTIMHKLRAHPDLGGDTANAAIINEAYKILSDPEKRARYDRENKPLYKKGGHEKAQADQTATNSQKKGQDQQFKHKKNQFACPYCGSVNIIKCGSTQKMKCFKCKSVLLSTNLNDQPAAYQRSIERISKEGKIMVFSQDRQKVIYGLINDLSPEGMRFITDIQLEKKHIVKIESEIINAVAKVTSCDISSLSTNKKAYSIGVNFITVDFSSMHGTFISEKT